MEMQFRHVTPILGAEVTGLDPGAHIDTESALRLQRTFDERGALLFRGVDVDLAAQTRLVKMLAHEDGPSVEGATPGEDEPHYVSNREPDAIVPFGRLPFHSDLMWGEYPFRALSLYAVQIERPTVPTAFTSATYAWETLPDGLRQRVEGLEALHSSGQQMRGDDELLQVDYGDVHTATTPIAHRHPRTGRTMLFVCPFSTREIVGLTPEESAQLLGELFDHLCRPDLIWEHEWCEGDLLVWDNLAVQHARPTVEAEGPIRTLRKVMSDAPLLVDPTAMSYSVAR